MSEVRAGRPALALLILPTLKKTFVTTPVGFAVRLSIMLFVTKVFVADLGNFMTYKINCKIYKDNYIPHVLRKRLLIKSDSVTLSFFH